MSNTTVDTLTLKTLMASYVSSDEEVSAAKARVAELEAKRANLVEQMAATGAKTFRAHGRNLTIVSRSSKKNPDQAPTWFLKGYGTEDAALDLG